MRLAVDVMGGDHGPGVVVRGALEAFGSVPGLDELILVGNQAEVERLGIPGLQRPGVHLRNATEVVTMHDGPKDVLRRKKDSSMARAIDLVAAGEADAVLSCGNTGCLLAAATIKLRRLPGIDRAGIATVMPTPENEFILLDAGANLDCSPLNLAHYAIMGSVYSSEVLGYKSPRVGLLSNGTEDHKGTPLTQAAFQLCQRLKPSLNFVGNVEGHDLFSGRVDVVVCDGFVGNITLKTSESLAKGMFRLLKREITANPLRKLGALLAKGAFQAVKKRMDPDMYGAAPLLGLNGVVFKSHAGASERAIRNGIKVVTDTFQHHVNEQITTRVAAAASLMGEGEPIATS